MKTRIANFLCQIAVVLLFSASALIPLTGQPAAIPVVQTDPR